MVTSVLLHITRPPSFFFTAKEHGVGYTGWIPVSSLNPEPCMNKSWIMIHGLEFGEGELGLRCCVYCINIVILRAVLTKSDNYNDK